MNPPHLLARRGKERVCSRIVIEIRAGVGVPRGDTNLRCGGVLDNGGSEGRLSGFE